MIRFYGHLKDRYGEGLHVDVSSPAEAVRACSAVLPGFREYFGPGLYHVLVGGEAQTLETIAFPSGQLEISFVPVVEGGKSSLTQILLGAALIAVALTNPFGWAAMGTKGAWGLSMMLGLGASMALGGIARLLASTPTLDEEKNNNGNFFSGPENTVTQGACIPVGYGEMLCGSVVVSAGTSAESYAKGAGGGPFGGNPGTWTETSNVWSNAGDGLTAPLCLSIDPEGDEDAKIVEHAKVLDLISEGPIYGLSTGDLQSVYLDHTPCQNNDGSLNTRDTHFALVYGAVNQPAIKGMSDVESEFAIGSKASTTDPVISTVTNTNATAARVKVSVPALYNESKGDSVSFTIDILADGGAWTTVSGGTISDHFTSKFIKAYRIPLSGNGPWQVRLTRTTADNTSSTRMNDIYFESLTTIIEARLSYPYCAMAAVSVDAEQYSKVPSRTYLLKLRLLQVPANYDPITRTYATSGTGTVDGVWDGTFKTAWSDNPAWVFYDMASHKRYGAGDFLAATNLDKWALYTIAQYCDEFVDDGHGGTEPRFTCNCLITTRQEGIKLLGYLASVFRGICYWGSGLVTAVQDTDASPAAMFTASNVIDGKFSYSGTARRARHTAVVVYWDDPNNLYKKTPEYIEDQAAIATLGLNVLEVVAYGCTSQGQARRLGLWTLACELLETETVTFDTALEGVVSRPGEIIQIQDQFRLGTRCGGRIVSSTETQVVLDSPVTLAAGIAYQISCMLPSGAVETRVVSTGASTTDTIDVTVAFTAAPQEQGQWVMVAGDGSMDAELYRLITITESDGVYTHTALQHDAAKYLAIETGLVITPTQAAAFNPHKSVLNLTLAEQLQDIGDQLSLALVASWSARTGAVGYSATCSLNYGPWQTMAVTGTSARIMGAQIGSYRVRVAAHYPSGISAYVETPTTITGASVLTAPIEDLVSVYVSGQSRIQWDALAIQGIIYEIRIGTSWGTAKVLSRTTNGWLDTTSDGTYWVAAKYLNSYGTPASIAVSGATLTTNVVATWDESVTSWAGTLSGDAINSGGDLTLTAGKSLGYYEVPASHVIDLGTEQVCTVSAVYAFAGVMTSDVDDWANVDLIPNVDGESSNLADVVLQIDTAPASGTFTGTWKTFVPGQYKARKFKMRLVLTSDSPEVSPWVSAFAWTVDMPDRQERGTGVTTSASAVTTVTFAKPFQVTPNIQILIADKVAGDVVVFTTAASTTGFSFEIRNAGTRVSRTVNWIAQAY